MTYAARAHDASQRAAPGHVEEGEAQQDAHADQPPGAASASMGRQHDRPYGKSYSYHREEDTRGR